MHHGPLWQFFLATGLVLFVVHRGAIAVMEFLSPDAPVMFGLAYALQALVGAIVVVGVWIGRRWVLGALIGLGTIVALTAALRGFAFGLEPWARSLGQIVAAIFVTGVLTLLLSREFRPGETNEERAVRAARDPTRSSPSP